MMRFSPHDRPNIFFLHVSVHNNPDSVYSARNSSTRVLDQPADIGEYQGFSYHTLNSPVRDEQNLV